MYVCTAILDEDDTESLCSPIYDMPQPMARRRSRYAGLLELYPFSMPWIVYSIRFAILHQPIEYTFEYLWGWGGSERVTACSQGSPLLAVTRSSEPPHWVPPSSSPPRAN